MKICFIGNNANGEKISDGGRIKMRTIMSMLEKNGHDINVVDLVNWKYRFFSIIKQVKKALIENDFIFLMAGPNGSRVLIPILVFLNRKKRKKLIFCPVGLGTIDKIVRDLDGKQLNDFINCVDFFGKKDKKMGNKLSYFYKVLPENSVLFELYNKFYNLNNLALLPNFRKGLIHKRVYQKRDNNLNIVFLSRVCEEKGVLDLINVVKKLNKSNFNITLDIYGEIQFKNKNVLFEELDKEIRYNGECDNSQSYDILLNHDLLCLPTKYYGEGTPGVVVESFFVGTPCLISNYSQVRSLIKNGFNGFVYEFQNNSELEKRIIEIYKTDNVSMQVMVDNIFEVAQNYTEQSVFNLLSNLLKEQ